MFATVKKNITRYFSGNLSLQPFYEKLHSWTLRGMGFGYGTDPETSGEANVIKKISSWENTDRGRKVIFSVGAHEGKYTQLLIQNFRDGFDIYAFEPMPSV
ncbi:hypothetical protein KGQ31_00900, partial [Patescibacteria group bacterium]|nr:hypothetical protein [Patescibacteria group bacterium]